MKKKYLSLLRILYLSGLTCLMVLSILPAAGCSDMARQNPSAPGGDILDLTAMSSTIVYAMVNDMSENPDDYMGKTIRMSGPYYPLCYDEDNLLYSHYVVAADITACCSAALEFKWKGAHAYPDDYPVANTKIEVVGVFGSYEELNQTWYCLTVEDISIMP